MGQCITQQPLAHFHWSDTTYKCLVCNFRGELIDGLLSKHDTTLDSPASL